jgi:16S rRNA (cytosine1402-N4)-methyltransferase
MHTPVLFHEVMQALAPAAGKRFLDATVGGGGHTEGLLLASAPDGRVLGTDADSSAIARATVRLADYSTRVVLRQAWLDDAISVALVEGMLPLDGILVDL